MAGTGTDGPPHSLMVHRRRQYILWSLRPLAWYVVARVGVLVLVGATALHTQRTLVERLMGWDSKWYVMVAQRGYVHVIPPGSGNAAQSDLGFFPLMPLLIRGVHFVLRGSLAVSGLVASAGVGLLGAIALWWLFHDRFGPSGADRATALVLFSPAAFVLSMVYSEGAILLFVATSLLALRHRRWWVAGVCAALATAADPVGVAAIVPCVVAAVLAIRDRREWRALVAPMVAPLGVGLFFTYLWIHTGSPLTWFRAQRVGWQRGTFGSGVANSFLSVWHHGFGDVNAGVKVVSAVAAVGLLVIFFRAHPPAPWVGYALTVLALAVASPVIGITPRLLLRDFVLIGVAGARLRGLTFQLVLTLSTLCLAALTVAAGTGWWTP